MSGAISTSLTHARWPNSAAAYAIRAAWSGAIRVAVTKPSCSRPDSEDSEVKAGSHVMFDCHGTIDLSIAGTAARRGLSTSSLRDPPWSLATAQIAIAER